MIRTVIFDVGGVMVGLGRLNFYKSYGYSEEESEKLFRATMRSGYWPEFDRGVLTDEQVIDLFVAKTPELEADIRRVMANTHGVTTRRESSIPWIRHVKAQGRQVLYLSNYSRKIYREGEDAMDFVREMDGGVWSCDVHLIKPDPYIYIWLMNHYQLTPAECIFVDDLQKNLDTAAALGMHTLLYTTQEETERRLDEALAASEGEQAQSDLQERICAELAAPGLV